MNCRPKEIGDGDLSGKQAGSALFEHSRNSLEPRSHTLVTLINYVSLKQVGETTNVAGLSAFMGSPCCWARGNPRKRVIPL